MYVNVKTILRHKDWRKLLKKIRRKIVRKKEAEERDEKYNKEQAILRSNPAYLAQLLEEEEIANEIQRREELEAIFRREQWRIRDLTLHKNWFYNQERKKKLDQDRKLQEETIRIEWEEKLANEAAAKKKISDSENELLKEATRQLGDHSLTHNPEPPVGYVRPQIAKAEPCPFFAKTGACRFGYNCSRDHAYPMRSNTILLPNMYTHFGLEGAFSDDYDMDISLEYSESDSYKHFREFFFDVLPEFEKCGKVVQFKVCSNKSVHLKGNVYVQFNKIEAAEIAYGMFNGRWYAGRQISCVFVHIEQWKPAICGLHFAMKCPKGGNCNFLHVYRNPGNAFFSADRDWLYDKKAAVTPRSERRKSRSRSRDRNENGSSSRRNKNYSGSESRRRKNRDTSRSISSERLFYGTKHLTKRKSRSRSIDKRKSRSRSIDKRKSRRKSTEAKITSGRRSTNKRKSRSRSTNQRKSRSQSTERRKSKSSSTDRIKSKRSSLGRRKSRSSSVGRKKSRLKSTDAKRISSRSTNTNKSRSRSTDRRKSRSRSTDRRKSRSRSTDRRKSRSRSTDRRKSRSRSAEMRKSRSRSTEMSKSRSGSTDSSQSRSGSTNR